MEKISTIILKEKSFVIFLQAWLVSYKQIKSGASCDMADYASPCALI